ncbi:MAG: SpoIIE family protein phosphatase [SAR324 cluster bacterium]|nr:SpoIIE family protein phosphatase [SAR324 cluster bacterium]
MKQNKLNLLIVDDEDGILNSLDFLLHKEYHITTCHNAEDALVLINNNYEFQLVISDQRMPGLYGHELLKIIHEYAPEAQGILLTGYSDMKSLIDAVNDGHIYGYVAKPWAPEALKLMLLKARQHYELFSQNSRLNKDLKQMNQELELRVKERTEEIALKNMLLQERYEQQQLERNQARLVQQARMPAILPGVEGARLFTRYIPYDELGGDIYDIYWQKYTQQLAILLADVSGHGIPAALISFMVVDSFQFTSKRFEQPHEVVRLVNGNIHGKLPTDKFVTAFYAHYDVQSRMFRYTSAGHSNTFILRQSTSKVITLKANGSLLGIFPSETAVDWQTTEIQLLPGDKVFIYTDGIIEMKEPPFLDLEPLLIQLLEQYLEYSANALGDKICQEILKHFPSGKFTDDVSLVILEVLD